MKYSDSDAWRTWGEPPAGGDLWSWQAGRCAWCGMPSTSGLVRDHCHLTGLIRGLLCRGCNQAEGHDMGDWSAWRAGDNPAFAIKDFEIYVGMYGTTLWPASALNYYTDQEREEWWSQTIADLQAGGEWPTEAPWTAAATKRREADLEQMRQAFARFPTFASMYDALADGGAS